MQSFDEIGADVVVVDGDDLAERVRAQTGGAAIKLAIDAAIEIADLAEITVVESWSTGVLDFIPSLHCSTTPSLRPLKDDSHALAT